MKKCQKITFHGAVKFDGPVEKYVIICDFTGVDALIWRIDCQIYDPD